MKVNKELFAHKREMKRRQKDLIEKWMNTRVEDTPIHNDQARRTAIALEQQFKKNFNLVGEDKLEFITDETERAKRFRSIFYTATGRKLETKFKRRTKLNEENFREEQKPQNI